MQPQSQEGGSSLDDLRLVPLVASARDLPPGIDLDQLQQIRHSTSGSVIADLFGQTSALESVTSLGREIAPLLAAEDGIAAVTDLHAHPMREVPLEKEVHLLSHVTHPGGSAVLHARWEVSRLPNKVINAGRLVELDEFLLPSDLPRLTGLVRKLARDAQSAARSPRASGALLITERAAKIADGLDRELQAAAAVADTSLRSLPAGDPNDLAYLTGLDKALAANNHRFLILVHDRENWAWKRFKTYQERPGRTALPLDPRLGTATVDMCQAALLQLAREAPAIPTVAWGPSALTRISHRTSPAFDLTKRARSHLHSNGYPDVERMLQFLERLADLAQAYHDGATPDGRIADWAHTTHDLEIALHDDNIPEASAYFEFEGARLCNRPHVKVDDYKNPRECGRVYFALDDTKHRIVVDFVGLHDRY